MRLGIFFLPLLSDLIEFRRKLLLGKAGDEKCGMSLLEGSIGPQVSLTVQKPTEGQLPAQQHSMLVTGQIESQAGRS